MAHLRSTPNSPGKLMQSDIYLSMKRDMPSIPQLDQNSRSLSDYMAKSPGKSRGGSRYIDELELKYQESIRRQNRLHEELDKLKNSFSFKGTIANVQAFADIKAQNESLKECIIKQQDQIMLLTRKQEPAVLHIQAISSLTYQVDDLIRKNTQIQKRFRDRESYLIKQISGLRAQLDAKGSRQSTADLRPQMLRDLKGRQGNLDYKLLYQQQARLNEDLQRRVKKMESKPIEENQQIKSLTNRLFHFTNQANEKQQLCQRKDKLIVELKDESNNLNQLIKVLNKRIQEVSQERSVADGELTRVKWALEQTEGRQIQYRRKFQQNQNKIKSLSKQFEQSKRKTAQAKQEHETSIVKLQIQVDKLSETAKFNSQRYISLQEEFRVLNQRKNQLQLHLEETFSRSKFIQNQSNQVKLQLKNSHLKIQSLNEAQSLRESQWLLTQQRKSQLLAEHQKLLMQNGRFRSQMQSWKKQVSSLKEKISQLVKGQQQYLSIIVSKQQQMKSNNRIIKQLREQKDSLNSQLKEVRLVQKSLNQSLQAKSSELSRFQQTLKKLNRQVTSLKSETNKSNEGLSLELRLQKQKNARLEQELYYAKSHFEKEKESNRKRRHADLNLDLISRVRKQSQTFWLKLNLWFEDAKKKTKVQDFKQIQVAYATMLGNINHIQRQILQK